MNMGPCDHGIRLSGGSLWCFFGVLDRKGDGKEGEGGSGGSGSLACDIMKLEQSIYRTGTWEDGSGYSLSLRAEAVRRWSGE